MIGKIKFADMECVLWDYCGSSGEGVKLLRFVGVENIASAIWARLSSKETRDKAYQSGVTLIIPGRSYPESIALSKGWTYRTLRARLPLRHGAHDPDLA